MKFKEEEKCIKTEELNITGNVMTWKGTMIQLANISYITSTAVGLMDFPFLSVGMLLLGVLLGKRNGGIALLLILAGIGWIYYWYQENEKRKKLIVLTVIMNSGNKLQFLFNDKNFLNKVMDVLQKIIIDGGVGRQDVSINISDCAIGGNARVLSDLDI